jgi:cytochrome P450
MALWNWHTLINSPAAFFNTIITLAKRICTGISSAEMGKTPAQTGDKPENIPTAGFLGKIAAAEQKTPLVPMPDPDDPRYDADRAAYEADKKAYEAALQARGAAVAGIIAAGLRTQPYDMLQELLDQPKDVMPFFKPAVGPAVVVRHAHVIKCLERTDLFTVDPYVLEMVKANDDNARNPELSPPFMLGTDKDEWYLPDDVLLRRVVSRQDEKILTALARQEAEYWTQRAKEEGRGEIDIVPTLARFVPLRIVSDYLGVHYYSASEPSCLPGLRGGDTFPLDDELRQVFTFQEIQEGIVPTGDTLFNWVKDAFRNIFNNFNPADPLFAQFRQQGLQATEYLTAYIHELLKFYKGQLQRGEPVPDTMLTRLLRLQLNLANGQDTALEQELQAALGSLLPSGELGRRLSDSQIRANVFGTVVGGVVNPEEASARVIDAILSLKDGKYPVLNGSTYQRALEMAQVPAGSPRETESLGILRKYALEGLRLEPQGEVLIRRCIKDNTELDGIPIRKGTMVFVSHAAAMRDPEAVPDPLAFDITRDERLVAYHKDRTRGDEAPQSALYLQHGFGRHKCLGRYASEITLQETLRAMLRLGNLERLGHLQMDDRNLYAVSLRVGFS